MVLTFNYRSDTDALQQQVMTARRDKDWTDFEMAEVGVACCDRLAARPAKRRIGAVRSKLFVPGSRPELYAKALATHADAISIDLEDAVIDKRKSEARGFVADFLNSPEVRSTDKVVIVRTNAVSSVHFEVDLREVVHDQLGMVNFPKVESAEEIRLAATMLERAEADNRVTSRCKILATIESVKGLRAAAEIAGAHPRIAGLQLGLHDMFESLEIDRSDSASVHAAMFAMRAAAGEARVFAFDGAFADIEDAAGFRAEAEMARRLGYWGKSCVHPRQVDIANQAFRPSGDDVAFALRVLEASRLAEFEGDGAFVLDGKMIDLPAIRRAESIIASDRNDGG